MENKIFITAKEAAAIILTSEPMIFEWIRNQTLKPPIVTHIGRKILINEKELKLWLRNGGTLRKPKMEE